MQYFERVLGGSVQYSLPLLAIAGIGLAASCDATSTTGQGASGSGNTPNSGLGSATSSTGTGPIDMAACRGCAESQCVTETQNCASASGCEGMVECLANCTTADTACSAKCTGNSAATASVAVLYMACAISKCQAQCIKSTNTGSGGAGNTATGGTSGVGLGGTSASSAGGASTTSTVEKLISGSNWIQMADAWADPAIFPNSALNISGAIYGFSDGCATMTFSAMANGGCISGTMCAPDAAGKNWGVGIGFDFNNTGDSGTPPNVKKPWNATAAKVTGIGWNIFGTTPGFGVWVTNMDPKHSGACTVDDCAIAGPADGIPGAPHNSSLRFSSLEKDDWGGSGVKYTFDPTNILAIQFKLNARTASTTTLAYDFCVEGLAAIVP